MGTPRQYSDSKLTQDLLYVAKKLGHPPTREEYVEFRSEYPINPDDGQPLVSARLMTKRIPHGLWSDVLLKAGLRPVITRALIINNLRKAARLVEGTLYTTRYADLYHQGLVVPSYQAINDWDGPWAHALERANVPESARAGLMRTTTGSTRQPYRKDHKPVMRGPLRVRRGRKNGASGRTDKDNSPQQVAQERDVHAEEAVQHPTKTEQPLAVLLADGIKKLGALLEVLTEVVGTLQEVAGRLDKKA